MLDQASIGDCKMLLEKRRSLCGFVGDGCNISKKPLAYSLGFILPGGLHGSTRLKHYVTSE